MSKPLTLKTLLAFLPLLTGISGAFAQAPDFPPPPRHPPDLTKAPFVAELGLSEEQKTQIQKVQEQSRSNFEERQKSVQEARASLDQAMDGSATEAVIWERFEALQKLQSEMKREGFRQALAIRQILTPEQRKKFSELRKKRFEEFRRKHPDMPPPPP
ncbi:MAG TPA: Spy/CpxP family protein refolding chaperone [bacterium]|nr:Spy/CpxP family protein refolding chaperone [bacterium]